MSNRILTNKLYNSKGRVIFYHPVVLNPNASSASGIRPVKMLNALENSGYVVDKVVGFSYDRALAFRKIKENVRNGIQYQFVYGESSTMPSELTDPGHLPKRPLLDLRFFMFCKRKKIPVGIFYRDIYWRFPEYKKKVSWFKRQIAILFYRFDLLQYRSYLKKIFVPSMEFTKYVPSRLKKSQYTSLPPAFDQTIKPGNAQIPPLTLLYVGGIGSLYRIHALFEAVKQDLNFKLIICTRKIEWREAKKEYLRGEIPTNLSIVHMEGDNLKELYKNSQIALLFVEPDKYRSIAVPYKLYEYIGYGLPVIASKGTLAGEIVELLDIGWCIEYSSEKLISLIMKIKSNPEMIREKQSNIRAIRQLHTWNHRIGEIEKVLIGKDDLA